MALDVFLTIDNKKGESTDKQFPGSFGVYSFSWGETNTFNPTNGSSGKPSFDAVSIVIPTQSSTADFLYDLAAGTTYKTVTISVRNTSASGAKALVFQKYVLEGVKLVEFKGGVSAGEDRPLDSLKFGFTKITYSYWPTNANGTQGQEQKRFWDLSTGKGG
jgi:type VI protein secretion system component Hcp